MMSDSEKKVMKIIWENGGSIFFTDLVSILEQRNINWKIETIRTFIKRLIAKGLLKTERYGTSSKYIATVSENEYLAKQSKNFIKYVFDGNVKNFLASLVSYFPIKENELSDLEKFWENTKEDIDE